MKKKVLIILCSIALIVITACVISGIVLSQPASVVTKFEKERAKEIALFKEKMPGYIFEADNRAGNVEVIFMFHPGSSMTPQKFAKKYHLKTLFPKAEIKVSSIVTLNFKRNDYTKAAHFLLTTIAEKATSVYPIHPHVYAGSSIKYKPDISQYAENPTELKHTVLDKNAILPKIIAYDNELLNVDRILSTKDDYDAYIDMMVASRKVEEPPEVLEIFEGIKDQYSEEFFETNALLVTKQITGRTSVDNVYLSEDNKIYVVIHTSDMGKTSGYMTIPESSEKLFCLTVSKDAIAGATELITLD